MKNKITLFVDLWRNVCILPCVPTNQNLIKDSKVLNQRIRKSVKKTLGAGISKVQFPLISW